VASHGGTAIGTYIAAPRPEAPRLPVSLQPRPALLAGREELLARLHELLTEGDRPRTVVLCGLGGAGKTSLAVEYAHRHLGEVGMAWQLRAENPTILAVDMAELAAQLGVREDARDPVKSAHAALAAVPGEWLLVFDNAPDQESVRAFLPPAGRGRILITSQSTNWPAGQAVDVPPLNLEAAARFLMSRTEDHDQDAATRLAEVLGGLPLALEQAAAYIQATATITLSGYLTLFAERQADLLARGQATGYDKTVATTWTVAFGQLEQGAPSAAGLLRLMACLAPEPVPLRLLLASRDVAGDFGGDVWAILAPWLGDLVAVGDAVAALRRYSLVSPAGDGMVLMHRLVQAVTLGHMRADEAGRWRQAAAALVEAAIPPDPERPTAWPVYAVLLPHVLAVLDMTSVGMRQIARYAGHAGRYPAARDLFHGIADEHEDAHGPEHPDTLEARHGLAYWTGRAGDPARAQDLLAELLPIKERVLGTEHPDTLEARHDLAYWTGRAGDPARARDLFAELAPVRQRVLGTEHPDTLATRNNLAYWTGEAGDAARARDLFAELAPVRERVLGTEHADALDARHDLAYWTGRAGDPARARDLTAELLPVIEQLLGAVQPKSLEARHDLARWTGEAGDAARARDLLAELLPIKERVLGTEHPDALEARHDLAYWTEEAKRGRR
jgi:hypothetical protein